MEARYAKLDPEEEIRKAFRLFDTEGTGKVKANTQARTDAQKNWYSLQVSLEIVVLTGKYCCFCRRLTQLTPQITVKNLQRVAKELGDDSLGDRELQAMIDEFDKNLDGSVSLDEFVVR